MIKKKDSINYKQWKIPASRFKREKLSKKKKKKIRGLPTSVCDCNSRWQGADTREKEREREGVQSRNREGEPITSSTCTWCNFLRAAFERTSGYTPVQESREREARHPGSDGLDSRRVVRGQTEGLLWRYYVCWRVNHDGSWTGISLNSSHCQT